MGMVRPVTCRGVVILLVWIQILTQTTVEAQVPTGCDGIMDLTFILDSSESLIEYDPYGQPYYNWALLKGFIKQIVAGLPVSQEQTRIAFVQYSTYAKTVFDLNTHTDSASVQTAIDTQVMHEGGYTYTSYALRFTADNVFTNNNFNPGQSDRPYVKNVAVLFSDGLSNYDQASTKYQASYLKNKAPELYAVGVSKYTDEGELKDIASKPTDKYYLQLSNYELLDYYASVLVHRLCNLTDPPPPTDEVPTCELVMDLTLLVDNSGSIRDKNPTGDPGYDNYDALLSFLVSLVDILDVAADATRIAAVRFSSTAKLEFKLNEYVTKEDVIAAILSMAYDGSFTNISGAIRMATNEIYLSWEGDREDARDVIIIVTDGQSNVDQELTIPEADQAKARGIAMFVVGVTDEINDVELKGIASLPTSDHFFNSTNIMSLDNILQQLIKHVCSGTNDNSNYNIGRRKREAAQCEDEECYMSQDDDDVLDAIPDTYSFKNTIKEILWGSGAAALSSMASLIISCTLLPLLLHCFNAAA